MKYAGSTDKQRVGQQMLRAWIGSFEKSRLNSCRRAL
jgi:hypothetical protein